MQPKLLTDVFQPKPSVNDASGISTRTYFPDNNPKPVVAAPPPTPPRAVSVINTPKGN